MMLLQLLSFVLCASARDVEAATAPERCPGDTERTMCGTACENICGQEAPGACHFMCIPNVCQCPAGMWRTADDRCVESNMECEAEPQPTCPGDTVFQGCGTACEKICGQPEPGFCTFQCVAGCQCPSGMWRTADDRCVRRERQCPKEPPQCPGETYFQTCGTACEKECGKPEPNSCTKQCVRGCQCAPGYWRTADNRCVAEEKQCKPEPTCPGELVFQGCGTACPKTCGEPEAPFCTLQCVAECQCPAGQWRTADDRCVDKEEQCKPEPTCPGELVFNGCGTACPKICGQPEPTFCTYQCVPECQCPAGQWRTADDRCVEESAQCDKRPPPAVCPGETFYQSCGTACEKICGEPEPELCIDMCVSGCQCKPGQWRTKDDRCVNVEKACNEGPEPTCPGQTVWHECGTSCEAKCGEPRPTLCDLMCVQGCQCPHNRFRTADDRCVREKQCPQEETCPGETERMECGTACPLTCGEPAPEGCTKQCVVNACQCPPGMWRTPDDRCVKSERQCRRRPRLAPIGSIGLREGLGDSDSEKPTCPGETVFQACGTPCEAKCGKEKPSYCKSLDKVIANAPGELCTKDVCQCPPGLKRTADDRCVETCGPALPEPVDDYPTFADFQNACAKLSGGACKRIGCGKAKGQNACPVPLAPAVIKCSNIQTAEDCLKVGCKPKTKGNGKTSCKGSADRWTPSVSS